MAPPSSTLAIRILSALVPDDYFADSWLAAYPLLAMVVMLFVGIPVYVCATASVPVAVRLSVSSVVIAAESGCTSRLIMAPWSTVITLVSVKPL